MESDEHSPRSVFLAAAEIADPAERAHYVEAACAGNAAWRREVEELLAASAKAGGFLADRPASAPAVEQLGDSIGRYKLLQKIGEGGCGIVYMAEQEEPVKRRVALKVIKLGMDTKEVIARFEAERQALALMDHPHIAKVLDGGATVTGRPYFVMELVRGIPITRFCDQNSLQTGQRLKLFIKVCQAIQHAHQKGVIHRDIKPSNVLVADHDGTPVPKVIDFGIAKATAGQTLTDKTLFTVFEQFIGTPAYMSPEQAKLSAMDVDTRSDIYSLGVLLYELLTSRTPFEARRLLQSGFDEIRRIIQEEDPLRPSTRLRMLDQAEQTKVARQRQSDPPRLLEVMRGDLDWIVMKCLEKDRTRRYETATGLAADIERHLENEPVIARPPSTSYRLQKLVQRNRLAFIAVAGVAAALLAGIAVSVWQAARATAAEKVAVEKSDVAERERQHANVETLAAQRNLYAADMNLAEKAFEANNLRFCLDLLNRHRPVPGLLDLRGWEWRYLWGKCQSDELYNFATYPKPLGRMAISRDGRWLAGAAGNRVGLWEISSRRLVASLQPNEDSDEAIPEIAFSPDGKVLAVGASTGGLELWELAKQRLTTRIPQEPTFDRRAVAFSPDGMTLAISVPDGSINLWSVPSNTITGTLYGHSYPVRCLAFSPDGQTLISGSGNPWPANSFENTDNSVRAWSVPARQQITLFTNHLLGIHSVAIAGNGRTVASASGDCTVRIWDLETKCLVAVLTNHSRFVFSVAFSPKGDILASASGDYTIRLWNTANWQEIRTLKGSLNEVWDVNFSPDGKTLYSVDKDGKVKAWPIELRPRLEQTRVLQCPSDALTFGISSDSGMAICLHSNRTFNLWESGSLSKLPDHHWPQGATTDGAWACSPSGERLAFPASKDSLVVWDVAGERALSNFHWAYTNEPSLQFSPDGHLLAAASGDTLTLFDMEQLKEIGTLPKAHGRLRDLRFSHNDSTIAASDYGEMVELWNLPRRVSLGNWQPHNERTSAFAFMPGGKRLVTVGNDATAALWAVPGQTRLQLFPQTLNAYLAVAVSPDGGRVAAGDSDGILHIWDPATGHEVFAFKPFEQSPVKGLAFLPDGNTLVSAGFRQVKVWRAPSWEEIAAAEAKQ